MVFQQNSRRRDIFSRRKGSIEDLGSSQATEQRESDAARRAPTNVEHSKPMEWW